MRELIRTNDPVVLSLATTLLKDAEVAAVVFDENMSIVEGSIGILAKRLMVASDDYDRAKQILIDADLQEWVKTK